ncbi:MAG: hypothetical protein A2Y25_08315 [Candidatus Melainabacteria bacterium GWF2_37_15]|nr:MAG: hypothetical protein A2Y25_08315 [Candidatus Melainabacteria bacterium GWF2_37_15]
MFNQLLDYINLGYAVFPVYSAMDGKCTCCNPDCKSKGKHSKIGEGPFAATKNIKKIENMHQLWVNSNIGIATGKISGIVVLDIDPRDDGDKVLKRFEAQYDKLPETVTTLSGGGGLHYYFKYPDFDIPSRNALRLGFDFKSDGDWIVAPPSMHISGKTYEWEKGKGHYDIPLAPLPGWLAKLALN